MISDRVRLRKPLDLRSNKCSKCFWAIFETFKKVCNLFMLATVLIQFIYLSTVYSCAVCHRNTIIKSLYPKFWSNFWECLEYQCIECIHIWHYCWSETFQLCFDLHIFLALSHKNFLICVWSQNNLICVICKSQTLVLVIKTLWLKPDIWWYVYS